MLFPCVACAKTQSTGFALRASEDVIASALRDWQPSCDRGEGRLTGWKLDMTKLGGKSRKRNFVGARFLKLSVLIQSLWVGREGDPDTRSLLKKLFICLLLTV